MRRDFTKSNKDYFNKNKYALIIFAIFLVVGIIVCSVFGFKENFEFAGYNEFSIRVGSEANRSDIAENVAEIVNNYGGDFDTASVYDEGDNTRIVIRYNSALTEDKQSEINTAIVTKLSLDATDISEHVHHSSSITSTDYIYTVCTILLLIMIATIFAYFRYNGASAMSVILSAILGTLLFMSIGAILRLTIGSSYFAMLVALNVLIIYANFVIFEEIRSTNWLQNKEYANALETGLSNTRFKLCAINIAILILGLLFAIFAPSAIKYVSLNIMFIAVVVLATALYIVPFVWSVFITHCKKPKLSIKVESEEIEEKSNK